MRRNRPPGFQTRAIHHGYEPAAHNRAVTPPIYMTSTFAFDSVVWMRSWVISDAS